MRSCPGQACIDQTAISASLACLPVFLAGCNKLLVVAGPTYTERLWCIMELFTYQYMGGSAHQITFLPISEAKEGGAPSLRKAGSSLGDLKGTDTLAAFASFDARAAKCFKPEEKDALLSVIESGAGSIETFNTSVRQMFAKTASQLQAASRAQASERWGEARRESSARSVFSRRSSLETASSGSGEAGGSGRRTTLRRKRTDQSVELFVAKSCPV